MTPNPNKEVKECEVFKKTGTHFRPLNDYKWCCKPSPSEWEEEFDTWMNKNATFMKGISSNLIPDLKSFIKNLLHTEREKAKEEGIIQGAQASPRYYEIIKEELVVSIEKVKQQTLASLRERIEEMKGDKDKIIVSGEEEAYNQALFQVLKLLTDCVSSLDEQK